VEHTGGIVSARGLVRGGGIAGYGVRAIGVPQDHNEVTHASHVEKVSKIGDMAGCAGQEIVAQSEVFDGISREG
jgi:hypothetical protein